MSTNENYIVGLTSTNVAKWRAALTAMNAGTRSARLAVMGDSNTMGHTTTSDAKQKTAWPNKLVKYLPEYFDHAFNAGLFGDQLSPSAYGTYDTRTVLGTGWTQEETNEGNLGGSFFKATTSATGYLAFTPRTKFDRVKIYHTQYSTGATSVPVRLNGVTSLGNLDGNDATSQVAKTQFSVTLGFNTIEIGPPVGGNIFISGIEIWDSTRPGIGVFQFGQYGDEPSDFVDAGFPWSPLNLFDDYAPDLTIIALIINSSNRDTNTATYEANLLTMITTPQANNGAVFLLISGQNGTTNGLDGTFETYADIVRSIAEDLQLPLIDFYHLWTSYHFANDMGWVADTNHASDAGYDDMARKIAEAIRMASYNSLSSAWQNLLLLGAG